MSRGILVFVDALIFLFYKTQYMNILGICVQSTKDHCDIPDRMAGVSNRHINHDRMPEEASIK